MKPTDRDLAYLELAKGQLVSEWMAELMTILSRSAAYKIEKRLEGVRVETRAGRVYPL